MLVQVLKIEPEQVRPFEEVAGELKQELAAARAKAEMLERLQQDRGCARLEGKPLAEAAAELKLPARTVEASTAPAATRPACP